MSDNGKDRDDDPFAELDAEDDGTDPFAQLGSDVRPQEGTGRPTPPDDTLADVLDELDAIERDDASLPGDDDPVATRGESGVDPDADPFADLKDDATAASGDVFTDRSVDDAQSTPALSEETPLRETAGDDTVIVPKSRYCQSCEFFDAPPNVQCMHPKADILELVGMNRFKVRNCPVVERRTSAGMVDEGDIEYVDGGEHGAD